MMSSRCLVAMAIAATCISAQGGMPHLPSDQWIVEESPVATTGGTLDLTFKDCGDSTTHAVVKSVTPASVTLGTTTTVSGSGTLDQDIADGTFTMEMKGIGGISLLKCSGDATKSQTCTVKLGPIPLGTIGFTGVAFPIKKGDISGVPEVAITLPASLPGAAASTTTRLTVNTKTGDKVICVDIFTKAPSGLVEGLLADTKCADAIDQAAWAKGTFTKDVSTCGHKCMGAAACVSTCITSLDGYTADCASCVGALTQCTKDHCLLQCLGGNTPACASCVIKAGCNTDFTACSGFTIPSEAPFGSTQVNMPFGVIKCGGNEKLLITNKLRPSIKFRTCSMPVDPKTGWACNHGTPFVDCEKRVAIDEAAELDVDSSVMTVLPVTFTATGAVDMVSRCYMQKPAAGWPATAMVVDQAWWDALQKSC